MEKFIDNLLEMIFSGSYGLLNINFSVIILAFGGVAFLFYKRNQKRKWKIIGIAAICLGAIGLIVNMSLN